MEEPKFCPAACQLKRINMRIAGVFRRLNIILIQAAI
jgi:hypothetical protein